MLDSPVRSFRRCSPLSVFFSFFFTGTATTEIYTLSLHDALPIYVAGAAGSADLANDGQDDVLRRYALRQLAVDDNAHVLRFALNERLRGEHMLDLGRTDAVSQRAESAVRRGMAVAADDRRAWQREALLRADDVHDALPDVELVVVFDAEILGVLRQRLNL